MKNWSNTEAELKKSVAYKKGVYIKIISNVCAFQLYKTDSNIKLICNYYWILIYNNIQKQKHVCSR